jgi:hypothetical protein
MNWWYWWYNSSHVDMLLISVTSSRLWVNQSRGGSKGGRTRRAAPLKLETGVKSWFFILFFKKSYFFQLRREAWKFGVKIFGVPKNFHASLRNWKKYDFFGVKSWFFTRNTPKIFEPISARRNFFKCAPLTWNPGSAPAICSVSLLKLCSLLRN